ncbi:hypothetical protein Aperf_G00000119646 [Anoplocephala perfoliata]
MAEKAAEICRLPSRRVTTDELFLFPFMEEENNVALRPAYLIARNAACQLWVEDPTIQVTTDRLMGYLVSSCNRQAVLCMHSAGLTTFIPPPSPVGVLGKEAGGGGGGDNHPHHTASDSSNGNSSQIPSNWNPWSTPATKKNLERLASLAILFLERYGYINFGAFKVLTEPLTKAIKTSSTESSSSTPLKRSTDKHTSGNPLRVIICGAGAAGLVAARQLTYFGAQVTVLEAKDRIGGRIWTYKQGRQFADLGAMIITGMSGNPSTILSKQGGLMLLPINPYCTLYTASGRPVSQEKDARIEKEFNRILATTGYVANKDPDSAQKSLGQVIEDLIRFQEHRITPLKISHRNLMSVLLHRKAKILREMADARQQINTAFNEWQALCNETCAGHNETVSGAPVAVVAGNVPVSNSMGSRSKRRRVNVETGSMISVSSATSSASSTPQVHSPMKQELDDIETGKSGQIIDMEEKFNRLRQLSMLNAAWKRFDPLHVSLTKVNRQLEVLAQNPPRDVYLTNSERNLIDWHLANLEFANATELDNLSLLHWDQDDAYELSGDHCIVRGGFGQILDVLTGSPGPQRPCGQIELKSSVKEISVSDSGVKVSCLNKAMSEDELICHTADVALCALPLGVLKESVNILKAEKKPDKDARTTLKAPLFNPPLPSWKVEAIERAGFGTLNKVVLFFDEFFWDQNERVFGYVHDSTEKRGELFLFWSITERPCLIALVAGKAAVALETEIATSVIAKGDTDPLAYLKLPIVGRAMSILRKIFSRQNVTSVPDPIGAYATRWTSDVHIRGSYSYVAVGSSGDDYDLLAAPITQQPPVLPLTLSAPPAIIPSNDESSPRKLTSRLYFTGEHTNRNYPASVQGAMFSALREVARIMNTYCPGETPITQHGFTLRPTLPPSVEVISLLSSESS